ncbi:MAG: ATP-binding protein, partial [Anaerolineae bacterium]
LLVYCNIGVRGQSLAPTDPNLAVHSALSDLEMEIVESNAIVECDTLPTVLADASQLALLFRHLIGNALKFRGEAAPRVRIRARAAAGSGTSGAGRFWEFAVQDNGIGIEPQYFDRIFVLFQRLHTRKKYAGSGIGLALCKRIVERHGGRIWVESVPGQGSTFYFTLPAADVMAGEAQ